MELILAQGANHTKPENLKKIVETIVAQGNSREGIVNYANILNNTIDKCNLYAPDFFNIWCSNIMSINCADYSVEEKYDGYSYLNQNGRFFSKRLSTAKGMEGQPIEKTNHVPYLSEILNTVYEMCGCNLHGELYIPGGISDDVSKIMGCTEDEAQRRQKIILDVDGWGAMPHYMLIDIRAIYGKSLINEPHRVRRALLEYVYHKYIKPIDIHNLIPLAKELIGDPRIHFRNIVLSGGEGIMIKRSDALYVPGKKPANNWIKGKKKITHDVVLMGLNDNGTGKNADLFGSMEFGHVINGKLTKCGNCTSGISDEMRQYIYDNADNLIAKKQVFEIEAIQESVKSFRNPVFLRLRDDKDWTECTPINIRVKEYLI